MKQHINIVVTILIGVLIAQCLIKVNGQRYHHSKIP